MDITLAAVFANVLTNPPLLAVIILVLGVILVNGATDAANAIATVISARALSPNAAIVLAVVCNFLGLLVMSLISTAVADTISKMVNFHGDDSASMMALCAAMVAIVVWAVAAWYFGIPTSESHALIAGITGAAIALHGFDAGVNWGQWMKVVYGIFISAGLGFGLGYLFARIFRITFASVERRIANSLFSKGQILAAGMLAFMHGAQDGQKFMSIAMIAITLGMGISGDLAEFPLWIMVVCALAMGTGTALGGKRIIKTVALDMARLEKYQGFAASFAASISLLFSTLTGLPVSTTHANTTAIMGVGAEKRFSSVKWSTAKDMVMTWVLTFPGCGLLGFVMAKIFMLFA